MTEPERQSIRVRLEGLIPSVVAREAIALAAKANPRLIGIVGKCIRSRGLLTPGEALALASIVAGVIQGILAIWQAALIYNERKQWSRRRLVSLLEDEMTAFGVVDFEILAIENFKHLRDRVPAPCTVRVVDKRTAHQFEFLVFHDNDSLVFRAG